MTNPGNPADSSAEQQRRASAEAETAKVVAVEEELEPDDLDGKIENAAEAAGVAAEESGDDIVENVDEGAGPAPASRARSGMFGVHGTGDTSGFGGLRLPGYAPAPAERPFGGWFDEFADDFAEALDRAGVGREVIQQITIDRDEITFYVQRDAIRAVCATLRNDDDMRFEMCCSVSGVDYGPETVQRLHVVYDLLSMTFRRRIRLEVALDFADPHVPSVMEVYPTADWHERETWDMFGVIFDGHPALTRILMPDDWVGHPQRKDYPLGGVPVEYHEAEIPPPDERRAYS